LKFATKVQDDVEDSTSTLLAAYHYSNSIRAKKRRIVAGLARGVSQFPEEELFLGELDGMLAHLWFAGAVRASGHATALSGRHGPIDCRR
jgi:hypothetical protein